MDDVQRHVIKRGKRSVFSGPFYKKGNDEAIVAWHLNLDGIRRVFEVRFLTHV